MMSSGVFSLTCPGTDKLNLELLGVATLFFDNYTPNTIWERDLDLTLSEHVGSFLTIDWGLDEDWEDKNRKRLAMVIKALYT